MTSVKTIEVFGFDADREPEIHVMSDASIEVRFNFMPPSDLEASEDYFIAHFERQMSQGDTAARLKSFLESYRNAHSSDLEA